MKNPKIILVSCVTHAVVSRTTWADWALDNGECLSLDSLEKIAHTLREHGQAQVEEHMLIAQQIDDADVSAWFSEKVEASGIANVQVGFGSEYYRPFFARVDMGWQFAGALDEAIANLRKTLPTADQIAEHKRETARRLMAEANALSPEIILTPAAA